MGRLGIRQGSKALRETGYWRQNRNRILQRSPHDQRPGHLRISASAPEVAETVTRLVEVCHIENVIRIHVHQIPVVISEAFRVFLSDCDFCVLMIAGSKNVVEPS